MSVSIDQVKRGANRYITEKMLPQLTGGKRVALGAYTALSMDGAERELQKWMKHPAIAMLNLQDESGLLNLDRVRSAVMPMMENEKIELALPLIGTFRLDRNDIDELFRYVQEG